jgi:hypothetical protein
MQLAGIRAGDHRAGHVVAQRLGPLTEDGEPGRWIWRLQRQRPVGTVAVVVPGVDPKDLLKVTAADDQQPV